MQKKKCKNRESKKPMNNKIKREIKIVVMKKFLKLIQLIMNKQIKAGKNGNFEKEVVNVNCYMSRMFSRCSSSSSLPNISK